MNEGDDYGYFQVGADLATMCGVALTLLALAFGYHQYLASLRAASLAHVNGLFRDLLRLEFDFYNNSNAEPAGRAEARKRLAAYKMWVLEEMWLWLQDKSREIRFTRHGRCERAMFVQNWRDTLRFHIRRDTAEDRSNFRKAEGCYNRSFYDYVITLHGEMPVPDATSDAS